MCRFNISTDIVESITPGDGQQRVILELKMQLYTSKNYYSSTRPSWQFVMTSCDIQHGRRQNIA